ncbi:MAG TPA: HlyD family efflux transporter periplasmic adaptor subunit [Phenylobacterium sp.]
MTRQRLLVVVLLLLAVALVAAVLVIPRLGRRAVLSGYIEGEPLYLAAPIAGTVKAMYVARGQDVAAGAKLFVVDPQQPQAQRDQSAAELAAAQAQAADVRKGQRPEELAVLVANTAAAEARARQAKITYQRMTTLFSAGVQSQQALDDARGASEAADAELRAARKQQDAARLGARADQIQAADARVRQAQASFAGAAARLSDNIAAAREAGRVEDVFFQQGEWAPANQPILSLLPDDRIKVRFFVPQASLSAYHVGGVVHFGCDGCAKGMTARIIFISPRPEFTPPVIYSREARDRLVFLVEALPSRRLNPGQPVDVEPLT